MLRLNSDNLATKIGMAHKINMCKGTRKQHIQDFCDDIDWRVIRNFGWGTALQSFDLKRR